MLTKAEKRANLVAEIKSLASRSVLDHKIRLQRAGFTPRKKPANANITYNNQKVS